MSLNKTYFESKGRDVTTPIPETPTYTPPVVPTPTQPTPGSEPVIPRPTLTGTVTVYFYKNNSDFNCVNKSLTSITSTTLVIKGELDLIDPVFTVEGLNASLPEAGLYMKIGGRYYSCHHSYLPGNLIKITGHVDVLMSHASGIKNNNAILLRSANNSNNYLVDTDQRVTAYKTSHTLPFSAGFSKTLNYYLLTIGN